MQFAQGLPDRVIRHLQILQGDYGGFPVDRYTHSLQTATRALRDGRDEEYVVCALLHDIGDTLGSFNHPDIAAAILKPFVGEANHWMVQHHGIFQGHYFFHHIGLDRDMRDQFRDHPHYERTAEFCELYDNPAFDPDGRNAADRRVRADAAPPDGTAEAEHLQGRVEHALLNRDGLNPSDFSHPPFPRSLHECQHPIRNERSPESRQCRRMAAARRPRRLLPAGGAVRLERPGVHAHQRARARARSIIS